MPDHNPVTALIITYNERANIERCLSSVAFASEIVVVDSYSTDGTYEYLLQQPRVKVVRHPFKNFTAQKNYALQHASHDWVLFIDADEEIPAGLSREILDTLACPKPEIHAYWFYRQFMFNGKPLRFSGWQTDKNIRLFRKSKACYTTQRLVHERLEVEGRTACLTNRLIHYCYTGFEAYHRKMRLYGKLKALEAFGRNQKFTYLKLFLKPFWKFFYNYVCRLGILDGARGITICYLGALEDLERYRVLKRMEWEFRTAQFSLPRLSKERYLLSGLAS